MLFVLQRETEDLDIDVLTLKEELKQQKIRHQYVEMSLSELKAFDFKKFAGRNLSQIVPVGSLEFVKEFLRINYAIPNMNPIEVPKELRLQHLLNREYQIADYRDVEKMHGKKFIKYASELKVFSYWDDIQLLVKNNAIKPGLYVVSELIDIAAEYRVFVHKDEIVGIQFYDGSPLKLLSCEHLKRIQEMILRYSQNNNRPKSYTLDVAILSNDKISIIELHPWCSVGLYGCTGGFLPDAYINGFMWYVKHNTPLIADNPRASAEEILANIFNI